MENQQSPPVLKRSSRQRTLLGFFLGATFAVVVFSVVAFVQHPGSVFPTWSAYTLPQELKKVLVLSVRDSTLTAYTPGPIQYESHLFSGGGRTGVARESGSTLIVRNVGGEYLLEENGVTRFKSSAMLATPSRAPTTKEILFAVRIHEIKKHAVPTGAPITVERPGDWAIHLYSPITNKEVSITGGYSPVFLDDTHFLFLSPEGVYRYDLATGGAQKVIDHPFVVVLGPIVSSPDRSLAAFIDPFKKATYVYRIDGTNASLVMEVPEILVSPSLSDESLYALKGTKQGGEVWKYGLGTAEPYLLYRFPSSLGVSRIVF